MSDDQETRTWDLTQRLIDESRQRPHNWDEVAENWSRVYDVEPPFSAYRMYPWTDTAEEDIRAFTRAYIEASDAIAEAYRAAGHTGRPPLLKPDKIWNTRHDPDRMRESMTRHAERELRFAAARERANDPVRQERRERALQRYVERELSADAEYERQRERQEHLAEMEPDLEAEEFEWLAQQEWERSVFGEVVSRAPWDNGPTEDQILRGSMALF